ncbi:hypothetical protein ACOACQ_00005, partial [Nocardioides sp. CPCC 206347]|uniref:hypothetical protein n=1 Tax=Nocardioides sp. CPCC 206347 TaxID=3406463 RepID=UPI003B435795
NHIAETTHQPPKGSQRKTVTTIYMHDTLLSSQESDALALRQPLGQVCRGATCETLPVSFPLVNSA